MYQGIFRYRKTIEIIFVALTEKFLSTKWKLKWTNGYHTLGSCSYRSKTINLSKRFVEMNTPEEISSVILHEIAHAIQFERSGKSDHRKKWKRICKKVGAEPKRLNTTATIIPKSKAIKINLWEYLHQD